MNPPLQWTFVTRPAPSGFLFAAHPPFRPGRQPRLLDKWTRTTRTLFYLRLSLGMMILRSSPIVVCGRCLFLFHCWVIFHCMDIPHLVYALTCRTFGLFPILSSCVFITNECWIFSHAFSVVMETIVFFYFINMMKHSDWFTNVKPASNSWNKPYFVMVVMTASWGRTDMS